MPNTDVFMVKQVVHTLTTMFWRVNCSTIWCDYGNHTCILHVQHSD